MIVDAGNGIIWKNTLHSEPKCIFSGQNFSKKLLKILNEIRGSILKYNRGQNEGNTLNGDNFTCYGIHKCNNFKTRIFPNNTDVAP